MTRRKECRFCMFYMYLGIALCAFLFFASILFAIAIIVSEHRCKESNCNTEPANNKKSSDINAQSTLSDINESHKDHPSESAPRKSKKHFISKPKVLYYVFVLVCGGIVLGALKSSGITLGAIPTVLIVAGLFFFADKIFKRDSKTPSKEHNDKCDSSTETQTDSTDEKQ